MPQNPLQHRGRRMGGRRRSVLEAPSRQDRSERLPLLAVQGLAHNFAAPTLGETTPLMSPAIRQNEET